MTARPAIGITGPDELGEYARAIEAAGGAPERLADDVARVPEYLARCDGIVFSGGYDIHPALGGAAFAGESYRQERDVFELALARELRSRTTPTFGICKGLQLLNVAFGGRLVADIDARDDRIPRGAHQPRRADGSKNRDVIETHVVTLEPGLLSRAVGATSLATTSRHHQAVDPAYVAPTLRVVGRTADGVIEAVEATFPHPWFAAVQWHPGTSAVAQGDAPSLALFAAFVAACRATA